MGNHEDWNELNRWKQEQAEQKQAEFLNRNKPHKGMKEKEFIDNIAKTVHTTKSVGNFYVMNAKSIHTLFAAIFGCIIMIVAYYITLPNPEKKIEKAYGDAYTIVSVQKVGKEKRYTFSAKENPDFQFHTSLQGRNFQEDYRLAPLFVHKVCNMFQHKNPYTLILLNHHKHQKSQAYILYVLLML